MVEEARNRSGLIIHYPNGRKQMIPIGPNWPGLRNNSRDEAFMRAWMAIREHGGRVEEVTR